MDLDKKESDKGLLVCFAICYIIFFVAMTIGAIYGPIKSKKHIEIPESKQEEYNEFIDLMISVYK